MTLRSLGMSGHIWPDTRKVRVRQRSDFVWGHTAGCLGHIWPTNPKEAR